jgi:hypothetical protein
MTKIRNEYRVCETKLFNKIKHTFENEDTQETRGAYLQSREDCLILTIYNVASESCKRSC